MSSEINSAYEQSKRNEYESLNPHCEGMDPKKLEGLSDTERNRVVGEHVYETRLEGSAGLRGAFQDIAEKGTKKEFVQLYDRYISDARNMREKDPDAYEFFKERIFHGREYGLNEMEQFMRDTAPDTKDDKLIVELYPNGGVLPKTELDRWDITNCKRPFCYGDLDQMEEKMDISRQGDTGLLPIAADRMVACRNMMALCGKEFSQDDLVRYAVDSGFVEYDPLYMDGFSHGSNEVFLSMISRGLGDIEIYDPHLTEADDPAEELAKLLDHGQRGMVTYNPAVLNRTEDEASTLKGKILENLPRPANETNAILGAVRDGTTGKVAGFMLCDSSRRDRSYYVGADRLIKAMDVPSGGALFTKKPYLDT